MFDSSERREGESGEQQEQERIEREYDAAEGAAEGGDDERDSRWNSAGKDGAGRPREVEDDRPKG